MSNYQWARANGEIISADYDRARDTLTSSQVREELLSALQQFGHTANCEAVSEQLQEVFTVTFTDRTEEPVTICAKATTPGGRSNLNDEQRIQQKSQYINYIWEQQRAGRLAVQLGVYQREGQTVFCAWKVKPSAAAADTPISRQIKITTIARAMKDGIAQQERGAGEYACAFRKEFIFFYIHNADWLHGDLLSAMAAHCVPVSDEVDHEATFRDWLAQRVRDNGGRYSANTRSQYMSAIRAMGEAFREQLAPFSSVFAIDHTDDFDRVIGAVKAEERFDAFNRSRGNGSTAACLDLYRRFLLEGKQAATSIRFVTGVESAYARNRILFGAPGTGKSYTMNQEKDKLLAAGGAYERVTFHPDYTYANFVGTYKPVPCTDSDGKDAITYAYVPGPFLRLYVQALESGRTASPRPFLLIIEEINRANVAAVFGDVFQLLDRGDNEISEYPIQVSEEIKRYLAGALGGAPDGYTELCLPDNLFIWATMNSADQGVFPMDTAFKRRWEFTYLGIDDSEDGIAGKWVMLGQGDCRRRVEWNALRRAINDELLAYRVNEDKLLGPYFIPQKNLSEGEELASAAFSHIFKNKVIMYLFDDAARQKRAALFSGCTEKARGQYCKICREFDAKGVFIFCEAISSRFGNGTSGADGT